MPKFRYLLLGVLLSGCANHPLDCAIGIDHSDCLPGTAGYESAHANSAAARARCLDYGFQEGTDGYAQCRMILDMREQDQRDAAMQRFLASTQHPMAEPTPVSPPPTQTVTTCTAQEVYDQVQMRCVTRAQ